MRKMKKFILSALALLTVAVGSFGMISCGDSGIPEDSSSTHQHSYTEEVTAPTCTEQGYTTYTCSCGDSYVGDYVNEKEHTYVDGSCRDCGKTQLLEAQGLEYTLNDDNTSYSVTGIGECTATDFIIPSTYKDLPVTRIGDRAFYDCDSLTSMEIGDSVTSIDDFAFAYCFSLTSVEIGDGVMSIDDSAFHSSSGLMDITVSTGNANYQSIDGNLYTKDGTILIQYAMGKTATTFTIPDGVTSIGNEAFSCCFNLTSVEIPDSVTSIGAEAFHSCSSLMDITVSAGNVNYQSIDGNLYTKDGTILIQYAIGKTATTFTIPDGVTTIGDDAFAWSDLTSVEIPDSVTSIGDVAFARCFRLTSVKIGDSVTSIGEKAFFNCSSLMSIKIPDSVTSIADSAFTYCFRLTSVELGDSVTSIGDDAFHSCSRLKSVEIGNSVTSIGNGAFSFCNSLTIVEIGNSVTSIGNEAFYFCNRLTTVYYKGTAGEWEEISIGSLNYGLTDATRYYYIENEADVSIDGGNYWHYDENGVPTVWEDLGDRS